MATVSQFTTLVQTEIVIGWISIKFVTDVHGSQSMNPTVTYCHQQGNVFTYLVKHLNTD